MKEEILTVNNFLLENQGNMFCDIDRLKKDTFLLRLEGMWNSTKDRNKIMEFIEKELKTL
jgi:hypothetical protein